MSCHFLLFVSENRPDDDHKMYQDNSSLKVVLVGRMMMMTFPTMMMVFVAASILDVDGFDDVDLPHAVCYCWMKMISRMIWK